jgi:hypothetical protein
LKLEKIILNKYKKLDEQYRILGRTFAEKFLARTQSGQPITSEGWQTSRHRLEAILPQSFQERIDWLEARQMLVPKLFSKVPPAHPSTDKSDVRLA